jgi:tetratricopeptide (TPR) repeat protein
MLESETGDEEKSLELASRGLAIAERKGDRFSIAAARENVAGSLRRLGRFDDALVHVDAAVEGFRQLGARWELASALTARGILHRLAGRLEDAVHDLREAYRLCRELKERSIITWTASSLAKALADAGETGKARGVLAEVAGLGSVDGHTPVDWLLDAEMEILLREGDRETALDKAQELLVIERERGLSKDVAALLWWIGSVFGAEAAGGPEEVERAREVLERTHLEVALRRPEPLSSDR